MKPKMANNNSTTSLAAQDNVESIYGETSWSSQNSTIPIHPTEPHQQVNSRPSIPTTWHDPLRQVPRFQNPNQEAVTAAGSLQKLPAHSPGGTLIGSRYSLTNSRSSLTVEDDEEKSGGKRIRIACDACRKKKTKCDGQSPCSICKALNKNRACVYAERPMKRKGISTKLNGLKGLKLTADVPSEKFASSIDTRLANLENVLLKLTQKLDVQEKLATSETLKHSFHSLFHSDSLDSDYHPAVNTPTKGSIGKGKEHYFGAHCLMTVLSDSSLGEIDKIVGLSDEHVTLPIRNMPLVFGIQCKSYLLKWIDPPVIDHRKRRELFTRPFPLDSQLVYDLIDDCYTECAIISVVFPLATIRALFEDYYKNPELEPGKRRQFKLSDFLIMTSSLLMSISSKIDKDASSANSHCASTVDSGASNSTNPAWTDTTQGTSPLGQRISNEEFFKLKNSLFDNAIFYYHRLSVISDGLETIKAIVHLMIYNESNWFTSHVNYILCAIIVRFAQDIGLHKIETYEGLNLKDRLERLQIWWLVSYFDIEICFRTGKPPLINIADVTVNEDEEVKVYCKMFVPKHLNLQDSSGPIIELLGSKEVHDVQYYHVYQAMLTKIRTKSYNQLFVSISKDLSFAKLATRLDELNSDMAALAESLPGNDRPRFFKDPDFHFIEYPDSLVKRDTVLLVHFTYLVHIMSINRLPYIMVRAGANVNEEESMKFKSISLDAARTVLVLVQQVKREYTGLSFYNWHILSAFLAIASALLDHPELPETESDLRLLVHTSMHFFGRQSRWRENNKLDLAIFLQIDTLLGVLVKVMLRAMVKFYEVKLNVSFVDLYPGLREHLDSAKVEFPMIFEEKKEFQLKLLLVLASGGKSLPEKSSGHNVPSPINSKGPSGGHSSISHNVESLASPENAGTEEKFGITDNDPKYDLMVGMLKQRQQQLRKLKQELSLVLTHLQQDSVDVPSIPQYAPPSNSFHEQQTLMHQGNPLGYGPNLNSHAEMLVDFVNEDDISLMFYSQMSNLPSFFYESDL